MVLKLLCCKHFRVCHCERSEAIPLRAWRLLHRPWQRAMTFLQQSKEKILLPCVIASKAKQSPIKRRDCFAAYREESSYYIGV